MSSPKTWGTLEFRLLGCSRRVSHLHLRSSDGNLSYDSSGRPVLTVAFINHFRNAPSTDYSAKANRYPKSSSSNAKSGLNMEQPFSRSGGGDWDASGDSRQNLKPSNTFDVSDEDIERGSGYKSRGNWSRWIKMGTRERKTYSPESQRESVEEAAGLLNGDIVPDLRRKKIKTWKKWHNRCLCGGNTALSIFAILLVLNIVFGSTTYSRIPRRPDPFTDWGKPGTTSEGLSWYPTDFLRDVNPIPCHSHNDYWRKVPLFSALYAGCISVEADVWKYDDELLVGHNTASLTKNRTFQSLYVNPLVELLERQNPSTDFFNGTIHGVFDTNSDQTLTLLVDVKTNGKRTWPAVVKQLEPLRRRNWLTYVESGTLHRRPVTVVGTGETPFDILKSNSTYRDYFFDAPLDQLWEDQKLEDGHLEAIALAPANIHKRGQGISGTSPDDDYTSQNSWYASTEFNAVIGRIWWGGLSDKQMDLIRGHVKGAHKRGLKVRYWGTPSWPVSVRNHVWGVLVKEGADVLNVDDLDGASKGVW